MSKTIHLQASATSFWKYWKMSFGTSLKTCLSVSGQWGSRFSCWASKECHFENITKLEIRAQVSRGLWLIRDEMEPRTRRQRPTWQEWNREADQDRGPLATGEGERCAAQALSIFGPWSWGRSERDRWNNEQCRRYSATLSHDPRHGDKKKDPNNWFQVSSRQVVPQWRWGVFCFCLPLSFVPVLVAAVLRPVCVCGGGGVRVGVRVRVCVWVCVWVGPKWACTRGGHKFSSLRNVRSRLPWVPKTCCCEKSTDLNSFVFSYFLWRNYNFWFPFSIRPPEISSCER